MSLQRSYILSLLLFVAGFIGCAKSSSDDSHAEMTRPNIEKLVDECRELVAYGAEHGKEIWGKGDPLPPIIKSLSPQYLQLIESQAATVVDIQISGGFKHRGYLVVCASKDPNYVPHKGRNWTIKKIVAGVFEYRE